jgi:16S rRNA (cytidine1402-2'-O)-methyltransferase
MASLYLIPVTLGETALEKVLPAANHDVVRKIKHFIVENIRTARRFLKTVDKNIDIDSLTFYELNQHTKKEEIAAYLQPLEKGEDVGVISEAGCPAIADPGADVVAIAQKRGMRVVPLVGPSSLLLALMASGFNGQNFAFAGYLPIQANERTKAIKHLEQRAYTENQSQLFIETPYRNMKMLEDILHACRPQTRLCIAADISLESEFIQTKSVSEWKKRLPDLNKRPCIFILNRE